MGLRRIKSPRIFRVGTRTSPLALAQTTEVIGALKKHFPLVRFRVVRVSTTGDEFQSVELFKRAQEGVFTKAIEKKLLNGNIDFAVHSLKDLPTTSPKALCLAATLKRADTADALVSRRAHKLSNLPLGARVGTGSPRRKVQLLRLRPDLRVDDIRGNLGTRIGKVLKEKKFDAVLVAQAGLLRTKKYLKYAVRISPETLLPAVGQAAIAVQARSDDKEALAVAARINHKPTETAVLAERAFLKKLHGGCRVPVGIHTKITGKKIFLRGAVFSVRNSQALTGECLADSLYPDRAGEKLARLLLQKGAAALLGEARA